MTSKRLNRRFNVKLYQIQQRILVFGFFNLFIYSSYSQPPILKVGEDSCYFGQHPPGLTPELFAPGIVSTPAFEHSSPEFSSDGKEVYWTVIPGTPGSEAIVKYSKYENGFWLAPKTINYLGGSDDMYPTFALNDHRIYFSSSRKNPKDSTKKERAIWFVEKIKKGYSTPQYVGFDSLDIYGLTVAKSGDLYFMAQNLKFPKQYDLYFSKYSNNSYCKPIKLPEPINTEYYEDNPELANDESYMIFESNRPGGFGGIDLYISFNNKGKWSTPENLGSVINTPADERFAKISNDKKYLFFGQLNKNNFDIYWVDIKVIINLITK